MEERRLLVAVALSLLALTLHQILFPPPRPVPRPPAAPVASTEPAAPPPASLAAPPVSLAAIADEAERRVEIHAPDVEIAFSNRGARLVSWKLLRYQDPRQRPEEMVRSQAGSPWPLTLETGDAGLDQALANALFRPSADRLDVKGRGSALRFEYAEGEIQATKELEFVAPYTLRVRTRVVRAGREVPHRVRWGAGVSNPTEEERAVRGYVEDGVALTPGGVELREVSKLTEPWAVGSARWAGVEVQYFVAAFIEPQGRLQAEIRGISAGPHPTAEVVAHMPETDPLLLYVGPKDYHILKSSGNELDRVVPTGDWIGPIVVALMSALRAVHGQVGNWGWTIVAVTLMINLVMSPLRHYSIANGYKMSKLAPEMRVIQEKYRKFPAMDPRRQDMQTEMSALYARHGMSMGTQMMVGCLPVFLTLPFLWAFYRVLSLSIDLRGADFLWISDLSHRDPLFVTPILMGISMLVMQRLTPSAMDPAQQRIMMIMPLVLVVMFFAAPAGLNLYWLTSNLCSIAQQGVTLQILGEARPKERRT